MATSATRKRRHHHRSRNGCFTCKQRHMRCDEAKPYCHNCLKSGGSCGYDGAGSAHSNSPSVEVSEEEAVSWPSTDAPLNNPLSNDISDPFQTLRNVMTHESSLLLFDRTINCHFLVRAPIKKQGTAGEMLDLATTDVAFMHTLILLATNHWVRLSGNPATIAFSLAHHKVEALRTINERLGVPEMATMDSTIGAVAAMTLAEVGLHLLYVILNLTLQMITGGSAETAIHHLNGLEHLIVLRGDLQVRPLKGVVQQMIQVADTLTSSETGTNYRFPPSLFGMDNSSRRPSNSSDTSNSSAMSVVAATAYLDACAIDTWAFDAINCIDWGCTKMLLDLRYLSNEVAANGSDIRGSNSSAVVNQVSAVQMHVDSLIHQRSDSENSVSSSGALGSFISGATPPFSIKSCALAGSIYVNLFLLQTPVETSIFDWIVDQAKSDFARNESTIREFYSPEHIFWILFVAGCAAIGRVERVWFRDRLAESCEGLHLKTWEDAKSTLEKSAWIDLPTELHGRKLWLELHQI